MPLIAELVTKLSTDTSKFNRGLKSSESKLKKFAKSAAKVGGVLSAVIGGVAVTAFASLLNTINNTADAIDKLAKRASKFGADVAGIQRLQYAADLSGVSVGTLDQGLSRLIKSLSDAKRGVGEARGAFQELGLSVDKLDKMSIDKQYIAISDAIKRVSDSNRQAQLSVQIFGRSGVEQLNLLRSNVKETSEEFDKFGASLTNEQAAGVEKYNDSVTRLKAIFSAFKIQLTAQVAPALEKITQFIGDQIIKFGGLGKVANYAAQFMVKGLLLVVQVAQKVIDSVNAIVLGFKKAQLALAEFIQRFSNFNVAAFGGEFNFERAEKIFKLQRDIANAEKNNTPITAPLQAGLQSVQSTLQQPKQKLEITVKADKDSVVKEVLSNKELDVLIRNVLGNSTSSAETKVNR